MAASNPITIEDTVQGILLAKLDENEAFVAADIGAAAAILYKRGVRDTIGRAPCIMYDVGDIDVRGNPQTMSGSTDTFIGQIIGIIEYADGDDQEEKIRYFAWAVKQVMEATATITDATSSKLISPEVVSLRIRNIRAQPYIEGEFKTFRAFQLIWRGYIPQNT